MYEYQVVSVAYLEVDISAISSRHPVRAFDTYWSHHALSAGVPSRNQINPGEIAGLLRWLLVLEVVPRRADIEYRYRLAGTGCTELFGIDYTGKVLGENLTPEGEEIRRLEFGRVLENLRPIFSTSSLPIKTREFITVHRGVFPVSASGDGADQIFVVVAPTVTECAFRAPVTA
ncbi:MAG: PAS domain-containing protein [Parvibaculum sp.]|nr:PAS domain-containing protein [Parvibaculum sp.]